MPSEDESEGRTYSEYIGSVRNARRHERDEKRHERPRKHESSDENERRERRDKRNERNRELVRDIDRDIKENKLQIPIFHGKSDVDAYLNWEIKIEQIFTSYGIRDDKKLKLATLEFQNYALVWWTNVVKDWKRYGEPPVSTWDELKKLMRKSHVPSSYHRELLSKLQDLTQGSNSVDEYYRELEMALIRANIHEDEDALIVRFIHGLNRDICDEVEHHTYENLQELVHHAIKVEQQFRRKDQYSSHDNSYSYSFSKWKNIKKSKSSWPRSKDFKENQYKDHKDFKKSDYTLLSPKPTRKESNIKMLQVSR